MSKTVPMPDTDVIIGVDTHKLTHTAVAVSALGVRLGGLTIPASNRGYQALQAWARSLGAIRSIGVEGTGSYGAGLSRFLSEQGYPVLEVNRSSRQLRHQKGKDDTLDAESAARSLLAGQAKALPKSGTSTVEMIRHLKVARDTAVKARSQAMLTIKAIIVSAPSALREQFDRMVGKMTLLRSLAALRPGPLTSTTASAKISLRAIARRWFALDAEVKDQNAHLAQLTQQLAPDLLQAHGMGAGTAAEMLILVGDTPSAFAPRRPWQSSAVPARSRPPAARPPGNRLNRGGSRRANAALYRVVIVRMRGHQPPSTTSGGVPPRERASPRSSAASSASSPVRSLATSAARPTYETQRQRALDRYRSIIAKSHHQNCDPGNTKQTLLTER